MDNDEEYGITFDRTPETIGAHVISFCKSIVGSAFPQYVPVEPTAKASVRDCFYAVAEKQKRAGGSIVFGWNIWTWPRVWLKAEHHAVWKDDADHLIDVTPKPNGISRIVFLSDSTRPYDYEGNRRLGNICKSLQRDPAIEDVFAAEREVFEFEENNSIPGSLVVTGDAAQYRGLQLIKEYRLATVALKYLRDSQPCLCGSGKPVRRCHGPDFRKLVSYVETNFG
jgi:hypothetical protein